MNLKIRLQTKRIILIAVGILIAALVWNWYDANVDRSGWTETHYGIGYKDFHGKLVTGWQEIGGNYYHFGFDKVMNTHWLEIDGVDYYLGNDGIRVTGWQEIDGRRYCFDENGVLQTGWVEIDGRNCYLDKNGMPISGWLEDNTGTYYLDESGAPVTGLQNLEEGTYFFDSDGRMASGWREANGLSYYFGTDGTMAVGFTQIGEDTYYFTEYGAMVTGWITEGEYRYYFHPDGTMAVGPTAIDDQQYYFSPHGVQITLVNPWNYLPEDLEVDLVALSTGYLVDRSCYDALNAMLDACTAAGNFPYVCSAYRTQADQEYLFENKIYRVMQEDDELTREEAIEIAKQSVAVPGTSEHQLGLAVDIVANGYFVLDYTQAKTETQAWLMEHCWEYGFILRYPEGTTDITGIIYEPWHYRYVGVEVSMELRDLGITLEEYLDTLVTE